MKYPTEKEIESADRMQLGTWFRFLPLPSGELELKSINDIFDKFRSLGGMTPALSKEIGWDPPKDVP